jgi:hypothetical protein
LSIKPSKWSQIELLLARQAKGRGRARGTSYPSAAADLRRPVGFEREPGEGRRRHSSRPRSPPTPEGSGEARSPDPWMPAWLPARDQDRQLDARQAG